MQVVLAQGMAVQLQLVAVAGVGGTVDFAGQGRLPSRAAEPTASESMYVEIRDEATTRRECMCGCGGVG